MALAGQVIVGGVVSAVTLIVRLPVAVALPESVTFNPTRFAPKVAEHATDDALTPAEILVLKMIAAGNANKQIADQLSITEETVKSRVKNILSKLGANDRTHAAMIGLKRGIIEL